MFSYAVTCLIWGDDPNNIFSVLFTKNTNISDIKLKILKRLNLSNDMIDSIKYYKVNEELYPNDKRFNIMKTKDSYKLVSPLHLFDISEVSNSNLMINCVETESSFNTEDSIGAILLVEEKAFKLSNLANSLILKEKSKNQVKEENLEKYSELNSGFYHDEDDENYNGDYEDDFSEGDNKQAYRKSNNKSRKEKIKKQIPKEEKDMFKNRIGNCKKVMCNLIKDNNCSYHQNSSSYCKVGNINEKTVSPNSIPTPTEDIINVSNGSYVNPLLISNLVDGSVSPTKDDCYTKLTPNKLGAATVKQSTPQSIQSTPLQVNKSFSIKSNTISNDYINNNVNDIILSNPNNNIDTIKEINKISNNQLPKKLTQDITSAPITNDNRAIKLVNNNEVLREMTIEETIPVLNTKSIKVQGTSNKNQNTINTNISHQSTLSPTSPVSYFNIGQDHDTPSEPVLYTDSIPVQETIIPEGESKFDHQTMNTLNYPASPVNNNGNINNNNNSNNININNNSKNNNFNQPKINNNKRNETINRYVKNDNNKQYSQHYSRIYYPDSDIEVMEFRQGN